MKKNKDYTYNFEYYYLNEQNVFIELAFFRNKICPLT